MGKGVATIVEPLPTDLKVIDISATEKTPYFYMLLDYDNYYLWLCSNRRNYDLDIVKLIRKEEISPEEATPLLEEGEKFFAHTERAIEKYLIKYGIK
jgi:hypothetical protein